jgi:SOS-response transcriptional repressor LexA
MNTNYRRSDTESNRQSDLNLHQNSDNMKTTFGMRLKQARKEKGLTQKLLASKAGIKQATISELESDKYQGSSFAPQLAAALGVNALWLAMEKGPKHISVNIEGSMNDPKSGVIVKSSPTDAPSITEKKPSAYGNVERAALGHREIPVISYVQAGMMTEAIDPFSLGEGFETITVDIPCSEQTFGLRIKGKSMLPRFEEDDVVIVDPMRQPIPGSFVVAKNTDEEATFKKYRALGVDDHGEAVFELVPLNDDFATLHSVRDHLHIIGVAIEHRKALLR